MDHRQICLEPGQPEVKASLVLPKISFSGQPNHRGLP